MYLENFVFLDFMNLGKLENLEWKPLVAVAVVVIALVTATLLGVDFSKIASRITRGYALPSGLPKDIVQERFVKVLENSTSGPTNYRGPGNEAGTIYQVRSLFSFVTRKSLDENFSLYGEYFKKNGWEIVSTVDLPHYKKLEAVKSKTSPDKITVIVKREQPADRVVVELIGVHIGLWSSLNQTSSSPSPIPKASPTPQPGK